MKHPFFATRGPQVFAHRGGAALAPENTIAAFDNGLSFGADGLEIDVRLSRDGAVVVHHDRSLERTTNLSGTVEDWTADELARADAGYLFRGHPAGAGSASDPFTFRGKGIGVPTLAAVLARYRDARIIIEMKVNHIDLARAVVEVVRRADAVDRVCLGSVGVRALREVRRIEPSVATSAAREEVRWALYRSWARWPVAGPRYAGYQVPEWAGWTRVVSPRFVAHAHRAGLGVQVWTVNTEADADRLLDWQVDALITDRPDIMVPFARGRATVRS